MKFGICLPDSWGVEDVHSIFRLATSAEELGFDSLWVSEHVFNVSYVYDRIGNRPYYEPLTILSYVAAITRRVALVLQRLFKEGCAGMGEVRLGAWRGSAWPVRYYPAYPRATATTHPTQTVPGAAFPAPPGRPAAS